MTLGLHPWLIGQAHRIRYLDEALARMRSYGDVWQAGAGEVARHWRVAEFDPDKLET